MENNRIKLSILKLLTSILLLISWKGNMACGNKQICSGTLHIAGLFPLDSLWGIRPKLATELAIDMINQRSDLLMNYSIKMRVADTKSSIKVGEIAIKKLLNNSNAELMLLGPAFSNITKAISALANNANLLQVSYAASSPDLSQRNKYPDFYRTSLSATSDNPVILKLLRYFNWNRIAIMDDNMVDSNTASLVLENYLKVNGITVNKRASFGQDPVPALQDIQNSFTRIIVVKLCSDSTRRLFCAVYNLGLHKLEMIWIISRNSQYHNLSPTIQDNLNCSEGQILTALQNSFTVSDLPLNYIQKKSISGLTPHQYLNISRKNLSSDGSSYAASYAFDAAWAIALALNTTIYELHLRSPSKCITDFRSVNDELAEIIRDSFRKLSFTGISGPVSFDASGTRKGFISIEQFQGQISSQVGIFHLNTNHITWLNSWTFPGKHPPSDVFINSTIVFNHTRAVTLTAEVLAGSSIVINALLVAFLYRCQNHSYQKSYETNIIYNIKDARAWTLMIGFSIVYSSIFARLWAYRKINRSSQSKARIPRGRKLFQIVFMSVMVDVTVLAAWQNKVPLQSELQVISIERSFNQTLVYQYHVCRSRDYQYWLYCILAYKSLHFFWGLYLCWCCRSISKKFLGSAYVRFVIAANVFITISSAITFAIVKYFQLINQNIYLPLTLMVILNSSIVAGLIYIPQILDILKLGLDHHVQHSEYAEDEEDGSDPSLKSPESEQHFTDSPAAMNIANLLKLSDREKSSNQSNASISQLSSHHNSAASKITGIINQLPGRKQPLKKECDSPKPTASHQQQPTVRFQTSEAAEAKLY
ncbi:Gamma-aminobutyric acid type B receptor subunit 2 [Trichoplax sp. H2]|nr:Gamma-aminobutyric acid type B receptor subunit 2 [Trichoplax sp. H2]|eukprot:RDD36938.1 Gamma-aminobutyric acid type B receptor subunit 2 [Trichoplax sp. H2]